MESRKIRIKGENVKEVIDLLSDDLKQNKLQPAENIHILISEIYYFRNNSELMSFIVLKIDEEDNCVIDIVAGGGGYGLFSSTMGAEKSRVKEIVDEIEKICEDRGWELVCY